ncbi:IPT/TIG domain-containing protein [Anaeromicrobium sediminis]|uniref:Fibronectin type-III domain-containing protein n=1 Tax=Anaeromicrobium sediminis TaxID=1478221 RepID=A0A267MAW0_9FIRM|nr:IPT/TIG domain-containing protein [Anaeromicrobium sediminis]PAB55943.1 hypothetical protein CCE28_21400 [Anaeromicrobium sediminis]
MRQRLKRAGAIAMAFVLIFLSIPISSYKVWAADGYYITDMYITKTYEEGTYTVDKTKVTFVGNNLIGVDFGTVTSSGYVPFTNNTHSSNTVQEFIIDGDIIGDKIQVGTVFINTGLSDLPTILGVNSRMLTMGDSADDLIISGNNLDKIKNDSGYKIYYENSKGKTQLNNNDFNNSSSVTITNDKLVGQAGLQTIVIEKSENKTYTGEDGNPRNVNFVVQNTYKEQFSLVKEINVSNLVMNPNRGLPGDEIQFIATSGLNEYDVFFLKNLTDTYETKYKGTGTHYEPDIDDRQVLITHVPEGLEAGQYYVVFTNKISDGDDPNKSITERLIVGAPPSYEKFTVIDAQQKIKILSVNPNKGADIGADAEISGIYFGSLNIPSLTLDDNIITVTGDVYGTDNSITIEYGDTSKEVKGNYGGTPVEKVTRTVKVIIGPVAKFYKNPGGNYEYSFSSALDKIKVSTQPVTDADTDPVKDVVIETETVIELQGFPNNIVLKDKAVLTNGFTFIASKIEPDIEEVVPNKIQVVEDGSKYKISNDEDRLIAIYGENFFIHRYTEGTEEKIRYPIVEFGNSIRLDKNTDSNIELRVFDAQGNELDGSEGNELGTKILVKVPKDSSVENIGKTWTKVINPVRNSTEEGLYEQETDSIEFVLVSDNDTPTIEEVNPNIVSIEGGMDIEIIGSQFKDGAQVIIGGNVVNNIEIQGDGRKITFIAPAGQFEGETQLQVVNPKGGIDTYPFIYVKTYTVPKIIDFSPKMGSSNTLVVLNGENLLKPDPTGSSDNMYKFIGTRVLLEGQDINEYNMDSSNNKIQLEAYKAKSDNKILDTSDQNLIRDYYNSIILKNNDTNKYYVIDQSEDKEITLSNGIDEKYEIERNGNNIEAHSREGDTFQVTIEEEGNHDVIKLTGSTTIKLYMYTPYKVVDNLIVGNRVKVLSIGKLYFTIPTNLTKPGYYDVTIKNPDTKTDSKINEQGFNYYPQPYNKPNISSIEPNEGSVDGGYYISIKGSPNADGKKCFEDNAIVSINGVQVPNVDTTVSSDGLSINIKVPKLEQSISGNRITVPVVVVNPSDGSSASVEDGFTYILPFSNPIINSIYKDNGKASGGYYVEITGQDFRYEEPYTDSNKNGHWDSGEPYIDLNGWHVYTNTPDDGTKGPDSFAGDKVNDLKNKYGEDYKTTYGKDYDDIVIPVLPEIYFGDKEAEITDFDHGYINVIVPEGKDGQVDVYLVNSDKGTSNKVKFTYESSNPTITTVMPNSGDKKGGEKVEIKGTELFLSKDRNVMYKEGITIKTKQVNMPLVRFGDITNKDIPKGEENSGSIDNGKTTVLLDGNLKVVYDGVAHKVTLEIASGDKTYKAEVDYNDEKVFVPVSFLSYTDEDGNVEKYASDDPNSDKNYDELILLNVENKRLMIERGYSPNFEYNNDKHVIVYTPSYYTVGQVNLNYINSDGGIATSKFDYKNPSSKPEITNITKDGQDPIEAIVEDKQIKLIRVNYKGGNTISILGQGFVDNATIQIGDIATIGIGDIKYQIPDKLTFTMPETDESNVGKNFRVVISNPDGGNASSDELSPPIYIQIIKGETAPEIESIDPKFGPSKGGTEVTINGKDFRDNLKVIIGEKVLENTYIKSISSTKIVITTPPHSPGEVDIKVENEDGELAISSEKFTYVSEPKIAEVTDDKDNYINSISIEGGNKIKIKGSGFVGGAKVIFAPVIKEADSEDGDIIYISGKKYIVESGNEATSEFVSESELIVTAPAGKLDEIGVMVVNPDKGATDIYENLKYSLPETPAPTNVWAQLYYDQYIKVNWDEVKDAAQYEIYVVEDNNKRYIGNTELTSFVYDDLKRKTEYKFVITAVGKYGSSIYSMESNEVETGSKVGKDEDGELGEDTVIDKSGENATITIGVDDYNKYTTLDLTEGQLAGSKNITINIPAKVIGKLDVQNLTVIGNDYIVKFNPNTFYNYKTKDNMDNAGVKFNIMSKPSEYVPQRGETIISNQLSLKAYDYVEDNVDELDYTGSLIFVSLDLDKDKAKLRRIKKIKLVRIDDENVVLGKGNDEVYNISGVTDRLGHFIILGGR